jgi:hypothetical protein
MAVIWKSVVGYEGLYDVSDEGQIRRVAPGRRTHPGRIVVGGVSKGRYRIVKLYRGTTKSDFRGFSVHGLVAAAFLGPRPERGEVNHKNGIKTDNRLENLEYTTRLGNARHAAVNGLLRNGERVVGSKLTADNVRSIRALSAFGVPKRRIAKMFGIAHSTTQSIIDRRWWKHVA